MINFEKAAQSVTEFTGSTAAFFIAFGLIFIWAISGPIFNYSNDWQLVINTLTTIITFLMVFIIQKAQNKDSKAIQIKLNELVAANEKASNRIVSVEDLTEEEIKVLQKFYSKLSTMAKEEGDLMSSHTIEEAEENHEEKQLERKKDEDENKINRLINEKIK